MLLSASDVSSKLRGVPGSAPMLTGDILVSSVKEPLSLQHDAASASKRDTDKQMHPLSKSSMQQCTKEEEKCKENGPAKKQPAMRGTYDEMEDAKNQSKKEIISTMSKSNIMQTHHGTKNESGNKEAILA